jgi:hypothetical protein
MITLQQDLLHSALKAVTRASTKSTLMAAGSRRRPRKAGQRRRQRECRAVGCPGFQSAAWGHLIQLSKGDLHWCR